MPVIQIDTDKLRQLGNLFVSLNEHIRNDIEVQIANLTNDLDNAAGGWRGNSRSHYENFYNQWRTAIEAAVRAGDDLGNHMTTVASAIENADNSAM